MAEHTPGPWVAEEPVGYYTSPIMYVVRTTQGWLSEVAHIVPDGTGEANARLIAAAPDLLAACEAYQDWTDASERAAYDNSPDNLVAESEAADRFENMRLAAIAKAKGEAPRAE